MSNIPTYFAQAPEAGLKAALQQVGRVMFRVVKAGRDPEAEEIGGVIGRVIEQIDIGA